MHVGFRALQLWRKNAARQASRWSGLPGAGDQLLHAMLCCTGPGHMLHATSNHHAETLFPCPPPPIHTLSCNPVGELPLQVNWLRVVLDEAHTIKNAGTLTAKAAQVRWGSGAVAVVVVGSWLLGG